MKSEYIALSPSAAFALPAAGFMVGHAVSINAAGAPMPMWVSALIMAVVLLLYVRSDAREPIPSGRFRCGRFGFWRSCGGNENHINTDQALSQRGVVNSGEPR